MSTELRFVAFTTDPASDPGAVFAARVREIARDPAVRAVCELGGGSTPLLSPQEVEELGLDYLVVDVSAEELAKADDRYEKLCIDAARPGALDGVIAQRGRFDLVLSRMVAEHVRDARAFHENARLLLSEHGRAIHVFPTLWWPPYALNRLVPERLSRAILRRVQPHRGRDGLKSKFPAYYRWCRGPSARARRRFERLGYDVAEWTTFYGHAIYWARYPRLQRLDERVSSWLVRRPVPLLSAAAVLELQRSDAG